MPVGRKSCAVLVVLLIFLEGLVLPLAPASAQVGESTWRLNSDNSVTIFFDGNPSNSINLHWSVVDKLGRWLNTTDTPMTYNPSAGNFSASVGPFQEGTSIEWVFHDLTTNAWYNLNGTADSNWSYTVESPTAGHARAQACGDWASTRPDNGTRKPCQGSRNYTRRESCRPAGRPPLEAHEFIRGRMSPEAWSG